MDPLMRHTDYRRLTSKSDNRLIDLVVDFGIITLIAATFAVCWPR